MAIQVTRVQRQKPLAQTNYGTHTADNGLYRSFGCNTANHYDNKTYGMPIKCSGYSECNALTLYSDSGYAIAVNFADQSRATRNSLS